MFKVDQLPCAEGSHRLWLRLYILVSVTRRLFNTLRTFPLYFGNQCVTILWTCTIKRATKNITICRSMSVCLSAITTFYTSSFIMKWNMDFGWESHFPSQAVACFLIYRIIIVSLMFATWQKHLNTTQINNSSNHVFGYCIFNDKNSKSYSETLLFQTCDL